MNIHPKIWMISFLLSFHFSMIVSAQKSIRGAARDPYASLSESEKLDVQKKLIIKLKRDTDFIAIGKLMQRYQLDKNASVKAQRSKKNELRQSKAQRESKVEAVSRTIKLMNKYPELGQLDSETRKVVLQQARTKTDSKPISI